MYRVSIRLDFLCFLVLALILGSMFSFGNLPIPVNWQDNETPAPSLRSPGGMIPAPPQSTPRVTDVVSAVFAGSEKGEDNGGSGTKDEKSVPIDADAVVIVDQRKKTVGELAVAALHNDHQQSNMSITNKGSSDASENAPAPANDSAAETINKQVDRLLSTITNDTDALVSHERYVLLKEYFASKISALRSDLITDVRRTKCFEFLRSEQLPTDSVYRVPCVPWGTKNLKSVEVRPYGLLANFYHIDAPTESDPPKATKEIPNGHPPLRIAVEMSGHMRTYKKTYESLVNNLLKPNQALLFAATYPDVGDKRYGIRFQDRDSPAPVDEIAEMYAPYLAAIYVCDVPTIRPKLEAWFPRVFFLTQWSWMIYQLFMMDLAHNVTLAHTESYQLGYGDGADSPFLTYSPNTTTHIGSGAVWPDFDIVVRVRPDLYIIGEVWIRRTGSASAVFNFSCGNHVFTEPFEDHQLLRAPHHPVVEWVSDPLSDHSAVGFTSQLTKFLRLFSDARNMDPSIQSWKVFFHGNTAERMWSQHVERKKLKIIPTFGWHIMLRNPKKYSNSTVVVAKTKRRKDLTEKIFGVTDPKNVGCPDPSRKMEKLPPKIRFVRRGGKIYKRIG